MANSFEEIALEQSVVRKQWLPLDVAVQEVLAFEKLFGTGHFLLACHAALPSLLTPELLHFIRLNFLDQQKTPWIAEMDFLLSPLCRPIERDLFEVEPMVREALLFKLEERYGWQQLQNVADFLLQHVHKHHTIKQNAGVTQSHEWIAQAYLQPDKIVQELTRLLNESIDPQSNDYQKLPKKLRIARSTELLAGPLRRTTLQEEYGGLVHSARVLAYTLYGNKATFPTTISATGSASERGSTLFPLAVQQWLSAITTSQTWQRTEEASSESVDTTEEETAGAKNRIERMLREAGWIVQDNDAVNVEGARGIAIRDFPFSTGPFIGPKLLVSDTRIIGTEFLGYLLVIDGEAVGVIVDEEEEIIYRTREQTAYHTTLQMPRDHTASFIRSIRFPLPFLYATTGFDTSFTNQLEPEVRTRRIFTFHRPETLAQWLKQAPEDTPSDRNDLLHSRLRRMPPITQSEMVSQVQLEAVSAVEKSLATNHSRALIQIPNGRGKTESLAYLAFQLLKFAHAQRILYLVDNESIRPRIYRRFEQASTVYIEDGSIEQFNIQLLQNSTIDPNARVCISTFEQLYSVFSGVQTVDELYRSGSQFSPEIRYNPSIPIEFFDFILIYDCAPDTYRQWQPLLEYFDAFIIGATESIDRQIHSFFNENLVYDYNKGHTPSLIAQRLWRYYDELHDYGFSRDDYLEQLTYLLFLKAHENSQLQHLEELRLPEKIDWASLSNRSHHELTLYYRFILNVLGRQEGLIGTIFKDARNTIQDGDNLGGLFALINREYPPSMGSNILGDIYEELLEKNATNLAFTPRALIQAIVDVMRPQPKMRLCDPSCGIGGFLTAAYTYAECLVKNSEEQKLFQERFLTGWDRSDKLIKLCAMNLFAHNIVSENGGCPVSGKWVLGKPSGDELFDIVLCHLPFGQKNIETYYMNEYRDGFGIRTRDSDLAYIQFTFTLLKTNGRAAIVVPNSVLSRGGLGEEIRRRLLETCDLHTILLLPANVFYETSAPIAVLFFERIPLSKRPGTKELWVYDLRTNQHFTRSKNPLRREHLEDFVRCYNPENRHERKETGRFRKFSYEELIKRDKCDLNITWLDAADQKPSEPISEIINWRFTLWLASQEHRYPTPFTDEQILWLERIRDHIAANGKFEEQDFNRTPFEFDGGLVAARFLFGKELPEILRELNELALPDTHQKTID